jgi:Cu(I)/Ag(I) efflux system membrane fusion protein
MGSARFCVVVFAFSISLACGGSQGAPSVGAQPAAAQPKPRPLPANATAEAKLIDGYLAWQERLAADDAAGAKAASEKLGPLAAAVTSEHSTKIKLAASDAAAAKDIAGQRVAFDRASEAAIALVQQSGNPMPVPLRIARCPMAFDNRGARWLQRAEVLANPYFGASMLTCGSVDATIAPGAKS